MKINTTTKRFTLPAVIIGLVVLFGGLTTYAYLTDSWPFTQEAQVQQDPTGADINLDPPTQQEIDASQDAKKRLDSENPPSTDPQTSKEDVEVGIAYANVRNSALEVRAFTNGVITGDGSCVVTASQGSVVIKRRTSAFIDVASTQCEPVRIPLNELTNGTWIVRVAFDSPSSKGQSEQVTVEVQQ